jgi:predicted MarR family transcription regulator
MHDKIIIMHMRQKDDKNILTFQFRKLLISGCILRTQTKDKVSKKKL